MIPSQAFTDNLVNSGWIPSFHVFLRSQKLNPLVYWLLRQGKDLKQKTVKGNKIFFDQSVPGQDIFVRSNGKQRAYLVKTVIRQALPIGCQYKKDVKQQFVMCEICPETFTQKTMLNKGKAASYLAYPVRNKWLLLNHGFPPPLVSIIEKEALKGYRVLLCKMRLTC